MKQRIQKIISSAGIASRRKAEEMLLAGRISVNGAVASLGDSADPETDVVCVDGKTVTAAVKRTYIMLNKPRGYVTTLSDEKGRRCVSDLVADAGVRLYPVGRLDMYSEGLLIMTDDGDFANRLMHPASKTDKTYHVWVNGVCTNESLDVLRGSLDIDGYIISPAQVEIIEEKKDCTVLSVTIHEGRNRQIRKMCEIAGLRITKLLRVSEGGLSLGTLKKGKWRHLTETELQVAKENET